MHVGNRRTIKVRFFLVVLLIAGLSAPTAYGADKYFSFDTDGVYPSSQGAVYYGTTWNGPLPESMAFAVAGGLLLQDTTGFGYATDANYTVKQIFDHNYDAVLEFRVRLVGVSHWHLWGLNVSIRDNIDRINRRDWGISLFPGGIWFVDNWLTFDTMDGFHVYRMVIPAHSDTCELYIDGVLFHTGSATTGYDPGDLYRGDFYWGDGSPTGGNAVAEWDYINLENHAPDTTPPTIAVESSHAWLWPPNGKTQAVTVFGTMSDDGSGLDLTGADFVVLDEYGLVQPSGAVTVQPDGRFAVVIPLEASRRGQDRDGRLYTVTIRGQDLEGNQSTASVAITVPHDQRK